MLKQVMGTMSEEKLASFVERVISLKTLTDAVLSECLKNAPELKQEQTSAFKRMLNYENNGDRNAQLLAIYINWQLRRKDEDMMLERNRGVVLSLFRSLDSTDFFEKTYLRNLARRLLSKEGYDLEQEKKMVATLKPECGENFQSQTELMFTSTTESEAFTEAFLATTPANKLPFTNFSIKVIEAKTWPIDTRPQESASADEQQD